MKIFKLIFVMSKIGFFSPFSIFRLVASIYQNGINLMTLLCFAEKSYKKKVAIADDDGIINYQDLRVEAEKIAHLLKQDYKIGRGKKVGFLCKNHADFVKSIFAVSRLGADIYLLNTEMSPGQLSHLLQHNNMDLIICDKELELKIENKSIKILASHFGEYHFHRHFTLDNQPLGKLKPTYAGRLVLLTGGTTGLSKEVAHKPSLLNYLHPFQAFITRLNLTHYQTIYIATPIYHGYGIAFLLLFLTLGKKLVLTSKFNAKKACLLIRKHQVEMVTVVPLMIQRMIQEDVSALESLKCIASGSAVLNPKLVNEIRNLLGDVLFNLYGTSEAGTNIIATPQDLAYSSKTLGRLIHGVHLKIVDENKQETPTGVIGEFCIKNTWSMKNKQSSWIETGDLGYRDQKGYYFLAGRKDDMIISGGVNVFPGDLEQILYTHKLIEEAAVIGVSDEDFGQRLQAFVQPIKGEDLTKEDLLQWLYPRVARFQMPKEIVIVDELPYTSLGKLDKKQLYNFKN